MKWPHLFGLGFVGLVAAAFACGASTTSSDAGAGGDPDAAAPEAAPSDAPAPTDAGAPELCQKGDDDLVAPLPTLARTPICVRNLSPDDPGLLFGDAGALSDDYTALHALCVRMNPAPGTLDHLRDPALAADLRAYFAKMIERPAMRRALADVPADQRLETALAIWLDLNGFEHVLCGELNPSGSVGGLHMWSEYYLAEREGRADYACTVDPRDEAIASIGYRWLPPGRVDAGDKPIGSFFLGMSPACLLAVGVHAVRGGVKGRPDAGPELRISVYGRERSWEVGFQGGAITTLFPLAE